MGAVVLGDASAELRAYVEKKDGWCTIAEKGGVGPLTVRVLMQNTLQAATTHFDDRSTWASEAMAPQAYADAATYGFPR